MRPPRRQSPVQRSNSTNPPIIRAIRSAARLSRAGSGGEASPGGTSSATPAARGRRGGVPGGSASASRAGFAAEAASPAWAARRAIHAATNPGRPGPSGTWPPAHNNSRARACLHGYLRLGQVQRAVTSENSTAVWYGSPAAPMNNPQVTSRSHPTADHFAGTAARRAAESPRASPASASTSSTGHRVVMVHDSTDTVCRS